MQEEMKKKIMCLTAGAVLALCSCSEEKNGIDRAYDLMEGGTMQKEVIAKELTSDSIDIAALSDEDLVKAVRCIDFIGIDRSEKDEELFERILKRYQEAETMHPTKMEEIKEKLNK